MGRSSGKGFWKNLIKNTYLGCCIAFRKEVLGYILPFPRNIAMHDIWIGLSVEMHSNSFSASSTNTISKTWLKC